MRKTALHVMSLKPYPPAYDATLLGQIDRRFLGRPPVRVTMIILLLAALAVAAVQSVVGIQEVKRTQFRPDRQATALGRWLPDAEALTRVAAAESLAAAGDNNNPYGNEHWFPTPPFNLMLLIPLQKIGPTAAAIVWAALKLAAIVLAVTLLWRCLGPVGYAVPIGVLAMAAAFGLRPLIADLQHANLNIFMFFWLALTWAFFVRGLDTAAGLCLALAIVTKITPALALVYFLYKRQWRLCAAAGVGLILVFFIVPGMYVGFAKNIELLRAWFNMLVAPFALEGYADMDLRNQSLYGVVLRQLYYGGWLDVEHMPGEQALAVGMEHMSRPITTIGKLIRPAISLAVVGLLAWACRMRTTDRRDIRLYLEFGLVLVAMLLLSERTWKHHATTLPIVFLSVWYALTCLPWPNWQRGALAVGLGLQWLLLVASSEGLFGEKLGDRLLESGVFCWGLVLCFLQTGVMLMLMRKASLPTLSRLPATPSSG